MIDVDERKAAFLNDLQELTRKYGIAIGGCGCCESPWLAENVWAEQVPWEPGVPKAWVPVTDAGHYEHKDFEQLEWKEPPRKREGQ